MHEGLSFPRREGSESASWRKVTLLVTLGALPLSQILALGCVSRQVWFFQAWESPSSLQQKRKLQDPSAGSLLPSLCLREPEGPQVSPWILLGGRVLDCVLWTQLPGELI